MNLYIKHLGYVRWGVDLIMIEVEVGVRYFHLASDYDGDSIN